MPRMIPLPKRVSHPAPLAYIRAKRDGELIEELPIYYRKSIPMWEKDMRARHPGATIEVSDF